MRISAKADYAVRAMVHLATAAAADRSGPTKGETIATAQAIPGKFLETILSDLRHAGLVRSQRGAEGGYWIDRPAAEVSVADVIRAVDGPLATVRGQRPEEVAYTDDLRALQRTWIALRHNLRAVLETVTLADLAAGDLPDAVDRLAEDPEAWTTR